MTQALAPRLRLAVGYGLLTAVAVLIGIAAAIASPATVIGLTATAGLAVVAAVCPTAFAWVVIAALLVPYTWSPSLIGGPTPAIVLAVLPGACVAFFRLLHTGWPRWVLLDWLAVALVAAGYLTETLAGASHLYSLHALKGSLLAYVAFRLIFAAWPIAAAAVRALIGVGVGLSLLAVYEVLARNPIPGSKLNNPDLSQWETIYHRGEGSVRAQATMGHPLALGSFLIVPLALAFAYRRWRAFAVIAVGEALTLSRGPYIGALIALVLCAALLGRMTRLFAVLAAVVALGLFVGPVGHAVSASFQAGTAEQRNASYRQALIGAGLHHVTLLGNPGVVPEMLFAQSNEGEFALGDVTSQFVLISASQGLAGLALWLALLAAFVAVMVAGRRRSDTLLLVLGAALVGLWVDLLTMPLVTSFQPAFWATVALVATRYGSAGSTRTAPVGKTTEGREPRAAPGAVPDSVVNGDGGEPKDASQAGARRAIHAPEAVARA
jgi:hypothetical protein